MITFLKNNSNYSKRTKEEMELFFKRGRYIELLRKGYSFDEMEELLKNAFLEQYDIPNHKSVLTAISIEKECLKKAYQEYQKDSEIEGLSDFINELFIHKENEKNMHTRKLRK